MLAAFVCVITLFELILDSLVPTYLIDMQLIQLTMVIEYIICKYYHPLKVITIF